MEESSNNSMSDKDRKMAESFEGVEDKEDAAEKKDKDAKKDKKVPRRSLFLGDREEEPKKTEVPKTKSEGRTIFAGLLKNDVDKEDRVAEKEEGETLETSTVDYVEDEAESGVDVDSERFQEVVVERIQEVEEELELPQVKDSDADAIAADAAFLSRVGDRLSEHMEPDAAIEDAFEDEISPPDSDATTEDMEADQYFAPDDIEAEDEEAQDTPSASGSGGRKPPFPRRPISSGGGSTGGQPPRSFFPRGDGSGGDHFGSARNHNVAPQPVPPDAVPMNEIYYREKNTGRVLAAGILGYVIGRRGGRKRTEARLEPEIRARDDKLSELTDKLKETEEKVRKLAYEKFTVPVEKIEETTAETRTHKPNLEAAATVEIEKAIIEDQEREFEKSLDAQAAEPELTTVERIDEDRGIRIDNESIKPSSFESARVEVRNPVQTEVLPKPNRDPRDMSMPELLEVAQKIGFEKTNLRELYERGRIDAVNVRRVVSEYLRGEKFDSTMRRSLEAVELQRELRNEVKGDGSSRSFSAGSGSDAASGRSDADAKGNESRTETGPDMYMKHASQGVSEEEDDRIMVSTTAAIVIGVLSGIVLMILLFIYNTI